MGICEVVACNCLCCAYDWQVTFFGKTILYTIVTEHCDFVCIDFTGSFVSWLGQAVEPEVAKTEMKPCNCRPRSRCMDLHCRAEKQRKEMKLEKLEVPARAIFFVGFPRSTNRSFLLEMLGARRGNTRRWQAILYISIYNIEPIILELKRNIDVIHAS